MKEIIHNNDCLTDNDITEIVIRIKGLIINNDKILIGNENNIFQFPGGHLEKNETFDDCLKREILEETGIQIDDNEFDKPFMKVTSMNKDWPSLGKNRKNEIYYYIIKINKKPDLTKTNYTEDERKNNYKIEEFNINEVIDKIKENIPNNDKNKAISPDMILVLEEYLNMIN